MDGGGPAYGAVSPSHEVISPASQLPLSYHCSFAFTELSAAAVRSPPTGVGGGGTDRSGGPAAGSLVFCYESVQLKPGLRELVAAAGEAVDRRGTGLVEGAGVAVGTQQAERGELTDRFGCDLHTAGRGGVGAQRLEGVRTMMVEGGEDP